MLSGDFSWTQQIRNFIFANSYPSFASDDVLLAQLLVGGIPQYLNLLAARQSIADEFERIFVSHSPLQSTIHIATKQHGG